VVGQHSLTLNYPPARVAAVMAGSTRLTLNASYDPPLGKLGGMLDRSVMHRVAQATMNDFLARLAVRLEAELTR
jgi:hypothetical protein